jgi:hemerythrin-like domain-containing protein
VLATAGLSAGGLLAFAQFGGAQQRTRRAEERAEETQERARQAEKEETRVSAPEDLMREHAVLHRLLLLYERIVARQSRGEEWPAKTLAESARLIQRFVEEYHQKLEEDYVFPAFEKAGRDADLVAVLRKQHDAATALTRVILKDASEPKDKADVKRLSRDIRVYVRMYLPHSAREGSVLFPRSAHGRRAQRVRRDGRPLRGNRGQAIRRERLQEGRSRGR